MNDTADNDPRLYAIPDIHGHAKGEHKAFSDERPIPLSARMLFLWFYHACRRGWPRFLMVSDHMNYLTFEDPAAINLVRRALKLAQAGDLYGAAETASVEVGHAAVVSEGLRRGMRYSIGAEVDNDPRSRPDAQNIVDAMKPDGMVRSVHFLTIDHPTHGPNWSWPFDNPEFVDVYDVVGPAKTWELYMTTLLDAVERLPGNIVGHFYVPALFGHWPDDATLEEYENALVDACEARGMAVELNTRFLYRSQSVEEKAKYLTAHRRLLAKCKAKNVGIAVGSDAHSPKDQGRAFQTVLALLDECGINELVFPIAGRLARVALRVERKVEPIVETPLPPADDRKPIRKARPSDDLARVETVVDIAADEAPLPKAKPRPKRSRAKTAQAVTPAPEVRSPSDFDIELIQSPELEPDDAPTRAAAMSAEPDQLPQRDIVERSTVLSDTVSEIISASAVEVDVELSVEDAGEPGVVQSVEPSEVDAVEPNVELTVEPAAVDTVEPSEVETVDIKAVRDHTFKVASDAVPAVSKPRARPTTSKVKPPASKTKSTASANGTVKKAAKPGAKVAAKAPAKKAAAKKSSAKKVGLKKPATKKAPPKKTPIRAASAKKSAPKKSPAKKSAAKKPAPRRR